MFPKARIVHTRRDPIDNCLAVCFLHLSQSMPCALDLLDIAHWYRQHERLMAHWRSLYGGDIHELDYDRLVAEPRPVIEGLLAHCGLPWDDACLDFHRTRDDRPDAERLAGARAALHPLVGPLAPLRAPPRAAARRPRARLRRAQAASAKR